MNLFAGLNGTAATILVVGLILVEETGVPLPFAPGDLVLVAGGFLVATGAVSPFVLFPAVLLGSITGMLIGFSWCRLLGPKGLRRIAKKLRAERVVGKASQRVANTGSLGIAIGRLMPGLRIYTTLIAGATQVPLARFLTGAIPATIIWVGFFTGIGAIVGIPATHLLTRLDRFATDAAVLLLLSGAAFLAIRHIPAGFRGSHALTRVPTFWRLLLGGSLDLAIVISFEEIVGLAIHHVIGATKSFGPFIDLAAAFVTVILYVAVTRIQSGATIGELLLNTSYRAQKRYVPQEQFDTDQND